MTNPNLDDVKALAERLRAEPSTGSPYGRIEEYRNWCIEAADMLDRLASQREDVIDREAMAETIHKARWPVDRQMAFTPWADADEHERKYVYRIADAIARSLPSREAIIEEMATVCDRLKKHDPRSEKNYGAAIRSLAAQPGAEMRGMSRADRIAADLAPEPIISLQNALRIFAEAKPEIQALGLVTVTLPEKAFKTARKVLAAQPRSNRVEVGAERNSIQIESSSDTETANAKSGIE